MNKSILLDLVADGNCYFDNICLTKNKEYVKRNNEIHEILEKLCKGDIPENEALDLIWKIDLAQGLLEGIIADEYFKEGFKLGLVLAAQNFLE